MKNNELNNFYYLFLFFMTDEMRPGGRGRRGGKTCENLLKERRLRKGELKKTTENT
jgi:hypothetical protein